MASLTSLRINSDKAIHRTVSFYSRHQKDVKFQPCWVPCMRVISILSYLLFLKKNYGICDISKKHPNRNSFRSFRVILSTTFSDWLRMETCFHKSAGLLIVTQYTSAITHSLPVSRKRKCVAVYSPVWTINPQDISFPCQKLPDSDKNPRWLLQVR